MTTVDIHANFFNTFLKPHQPPANYAAERAAQMFSDWQPTPQNWPEDIRCRENTPHAFHEKLGRWVPTNEKIGFFADIREFLSLMDDRKDYQATFQTWYDQPRPSRIPYLTLE
jgi:hypothetical protein